MTSEYYWSVIAVDPNEEQRLLGLDTTIVDGDFLPRQPGLYQHNIYMPGGQKNTVAIFPILLKKQEFDVHRSVKIGRVINDELLSYLDDPLAYEEELIEFNKQIDVSTLPRETVIDVQYNPYSSDMIYFFWGL